LLARGAVPGRTGGPRGSPGEVGRHHAPVNRLKTALPHRLTLAEHRLSVEGSASWSNESFAIANGQRERHAPLSVLSRTVSGMYDVRRPVGIRFHNVGSGLDNVGRWD